MRVFRSIVAACAGLCVAGVATAYTVSPLRIAVQPSGPGATQRVSVTNSEAQPITLAFRALRNAVATDGTLTTSPAASEMSIFPPRAVLQPGASQTIQVRFTGSPASAPTLYSIHVQQVPVNATQGQAQIKVATDFYVAAPVQPKDAASALKVTGVAAGSDGRPVITMVNTGTGIGRMSSGTWTARGSAGAIPVTAEMFDFGGTAYILPGSTRTIRVKPEHAAKVAGMTAASFEPTNG